MGGNHSNLVPVPFGFDYLTITFKNVERICVYYATDQELCIIREIIQKNWKGIQREGARSGCGYEFTLKGSPFTWLLSSAELDEASKLACHMLYGLYNHGLKLLVSSNLSQTTDLATWLFHREQTTAAQYPFACISVNSSDKLLFSNFPQHLHSVLQTVVESNWPQKVQNSKLVGDMLNVKLKGNPWIVMGGAEHVQSKVLIKAIIKELEMRQWILYSSSNIKGDGDTLFFRYDPTFPVDTGGYISFFISLGFSDLFRMIDAPTEAVDCARNVINQFWKSGIQQEGQAFDAYDFKLKGKPWWTDGEQAVDSRLLLCKLFESLMKIGWRIRISVDLACKSNDKSDLAFQRCVPISAPIFCLSPSSTDKMRIINAPPDIVEAIKAEVKRVWLFGVAREQACGASFELKLNGNPWGYGINGHDGAHGRVLLKYLIKMCANMGWFLILSADTSAHYVKGDTGPSYPIDVHSLWFMQMNPVTPPTQTVYGMPPLGASPLHEQSSTFGFSNTPS